MHLFSSMNPLTFDIELLDLLGWCCAAKLSTPNVAMGYPATPGTMGFVFVPLVAVGDQLNRKAIFSTIFESHDELFL